MLRIRIAERLFLAGLLLLAASLPLSFFGMSLGQFVLAGAWLLRGGIPGRLAAAWRDRTVPVLAGVYVLHVAGMLYSTDLGYALRDLRIKLPLLLLPVLLYDAPPYVTRRSPLVLAVLVAAVLASTLVSAGILSGIVPREGRIEDVRDIAVFISHIRLALLVVLSFFLVTASLRHERRSLRRAGLALVAAWFLLFLYLLESMTGFAILLLTAAGALFWHMRAAGRRLLPAAVLVLGLAAVLVVYVRKEAATVYSRTPSPPDKQAVTAGGHPYVHYPERTEQENAHRVWDYVCEPELEREWNRRSDIPYGSRDRMGHELKYTLMRFMTSRGLRKDSAHLSVLSPGDIASIENGIANADYMRPGSLRQRIRRTIKEYYMSVNGENPSGSSMMQRFEYWRTGLSLLREHWLTGVGTGDLQLAFDDAYRQRQSRLDPEDRHRAHNQFLTMGIAFGLFGMLYFVFSLAWPVMRHPRGRSGHYLIFFTIAVLSTFTEDTLETQAGVTFFAFLNCFFLFLDGAVHPSRPPDGVKPTPIRP